MQLPTYTMRFVNGEWSIISYPREPEFPQRTGDAIVNVHLPDHQGYNYNIEKLKSEATLPSRR